MRSFATFNGAAGVVGMTARDLARCGNSGAVAASVAGVIGVPFHRWRREQGPLARRPSCGRICPSRRSPLRRACSGRGLGLFGALRIHGFRSGLYSGVHLGASARDRSRE